MLANQGAVAVENARMVEEVIEKERMEEELSIARDLQVSMLPAECPQVAGFEIAAYLGLGQGGGRGLLRLHRRWKASAWGW